jgi:hypothetical protein
MIRPFLTSTNDRAVSIKKKLEFALNCRLVEIGAESEAMIASGHAPA